LVGKRPNRGQRERMPSRKGKKEETTTEEENLERWGQIRPHQGDA